MTPPYPGYQAPHYPYPGDDPDQVRSASSSIGISQIYVDQYGKGVGQIKGQVADAWQSTWSDKAQADVGKLVTIASTASTDMTAAWKALDAYRGTLVKIRSDVDDLNRKWQTASTQLAADQSRLNGLTPMEPGPAPPQQAPAPPLSASDQEELTTDVSRQKGLLTGYDEQYDALKRQSNTAVATCVGALKDNSTGKMYKGSTLSTVPLGEGLGLDNLNALHYADMVALAKKLAADCKDPYKIPGVAQQMAPYVNDPDFATAFYGDLGPGGVTDLLGYIGNFDPHAVDDIKTFSAAFGTAVTAADKDPTDYPDMKPVVDSFYKWDRDDISFARAQLCRYGDFPPAFLAHAARANGLDNFESAGTPEGGHGHVSGNPNYLSMLGDNFDVALGNNPTAARWAVATMGSDDYTFPPNMSDAELDKAYSEHIGHIFEMTNHSYAYTPRGDGLSAMLAAAGGDTETDGQHSPEAIAFAKELFDQMGEHKDTVPDEGAASWAKLAGAYVQELSSGYEQHGDSVVDGGFHQWAGQNAAFAIPPALARDIMHSFIGDTDAVKAFDTAAGTAYANAQAAALGLGGSAADQSTHLDDISNAYGQVAGEEYGAGQELAEEKEKQFELMKSLISLPIDLFPGGSVAEKVPDVFWDLAKHFSNVGLESMAPHTDTDPNTSPGAALALVTSYNELGTLNQHGYPGADTATLRSAGLIDPNTNQMYSMQKMMADPNLREKVQEYLYIDGPANKGADPNTTVYEAVKNASGRYQDGFNTGSTGD